MIAVPPRSANALFSSACLRISLSRIINDICFAGLQLEIQFEQKGR
jgi:hypothetical protein